MDGQIPTHKHTHSMCIWNIDRWDSQLLLGLILDISISKRLTWTRRRRCCLRTANDVGTRPIPSCAIFSHFRPGLSSDAFKLVNRFLTILWCNICVLFSYHPFFIFPISSNIRCWILLLCFLPWLFIYLFFYLSIFCVFICLSFSLSLNLSSSVCNLLTLVLISRDELA